MKKGTSFRMEIHLNLVEKIWITIINRNKEKKIINRIKKIKRKMETN